MNEPRPVLPGGLTILAILVLGLCFGRPFAELEGVWTLRETVTAMAGVFLVDLVINGIWLALQDKETPRSRMWTDTYSRGWDHVIFNIVVFAPIVEELVFRYVLVGALHDGHPTLAIMLSGVLFGLIHARGWLPKSLMGCAFAWTYVQSGSLWVPLVLHAGWNAMCLLAAYRSIDRQINRWRYEDIL